MPFDGRIREELRDALVSAFPSRDAFDELLQFHRGESLDAHSAPTDTLPTAVLRVIDRLESQGQLEAFVSAAKARIPGNRLLAGFEIGRLRAATQRDVSAVVSEAARPTVTVCTITKRTTPRIDDTIRLLEEQTVAGFEYLIIDGYYQSRSDYMLGLIEDLEPSFAVRYLPPKPTRWEYLRPALANALNTCLIWAQGDLIVMIDDCCVGLSPDFLETHLQWSVKGFAVSGSWSTDGWTDERRDSYPQAAQVTPGLFYGANCSFLLDKALQTNGFEEMLDGEQGQTDVVFGYMLARADVRIVYDPNLHVEFSGSAHTLTQLSPDPRKSQWGREPWATEPKRLLMGDGTMHYANEWLAHKIIESGLARPEGNHFELAELRRVPPALHYDVEAVQRRLANGIDPNPKDWRDGEDISEMRGGELVIARVADTPIASGRVRGAVLSSDHEQTVSVSGRTLRRFTRASRLGEEIDLDVGANGLYISPLTKRLCVAARTVRLYGDSLSDFEELRESEDEVQAVCMSPLERHLAAGGWDRAVRVWELPDRKLLWSFERLSGSVTTVAFLDGDRYLVAGTSDGQTYLWDVVQGRQLSRDKRCDRPISVLVPIAGHQPSLLLLASEDGDIAICQASSLDAVPLRAHHNDIVRHATVTSNGHVAVTAGSTGEVKAWDLESRSLLQTVMLREPALAVGLNIHSRELLAVTPAGRLVIWHVNPRLLFSQSASTGGFEQEGLEEEDGSST